jgi:hypothetical protein
MSMANVKVSKSAWMNIQEDLFNRLDKNRDVLVTRSFQQTNISNIFGSSGKRVPPIFFTRRREDARKEKEENGGSEQERGDGFLCGSAPRFPLLPTQLLGNAFNLLALLRKLSVIGSFHLPELHVVQRELLA